MRLICSILIAGMLLSSYSCTMKSDDSGSKTEIAVKTESGYILPKPRYQSNTSIEEALSKRRSHRSYKSEPISSFELAQILWAAYGITNSLEGYPQMRGGLRTAPSAGATYPLEIYALISDVDDIIPGVYRYNSKKHSLKLVNSDNVKPALAEAALNQEMIIDAPACLFFSAIYERTAQKYGERAINRYVCMDLGHAAQNVYLQVEALGLGTCAIGAFNDAEVCRVMQLTEEETPLYIMPIGKYFEKSEF